jgi:acyl dehydratase
VSASTAWTARDPAAIAVGDRLPEHTMPITLQRLVMEAGADRDFSPIHIDREAGRASGASDAYANTILIEGLLEAAIRRWAGLNGVLREIAFTMRGFNCVGDTVAASGQVTGKEAGEGDEDLVHLDVWLESHRGRTVEGTAIVGFPTAPTPGRRAGGR